VRLLVGGYTAPRGGAVGITVVEHRPGRGSLDAIGVAVDTPSPSALAVSGDGRTVFAVEEDDPGRVHSFRWDDGARLERRSSRLSGGADPCHLLVHPSERYLLTANYTQATVAAHPIGADGGLGEASDLHTLFGDGPDRERQSSSHPHMIAARPGAGELAVADLGADRIARIEFDTVTGRFGPELPGLELPAGSGPRQIVFASDRRAYVLGELDSMLVITDWPPGAVPTVTAHRSGLVGPAPTGNLAAALLMSPDHRTLFASHRGADVVSVFDLDGGSVVPRVDLPTGGRGPRHLALAGDWIYVTNEMSGTVAAIDLTGRAATLTAAVPSATFVLVS
jgi:6-phosphogluconolactonase